MTTPVLEAAVPLADTPRPSLILTPELNATPGQEPLNLLRQRVERELESEETYTITDCDYVSPEGPNYLMTIKPYYWEVEPGRWEARDGYQNKNFWPSKQQKQLESMSQAVYCMCLAYRHLPDIGTACLSHIEKLLQVFFTDEATKMMPEAKYVQCVPSHLPLEGDHAFIISMRFLILVSRGLLHTPLNPTLRQGMEHWSSVHVAFMRDSRPGQRARACGDNKTIWYYAVMASHLAFIDPTESRSQALETLKTTLEKYPTPTDLFKREVNRTRPVHYAMFTLEPLFLLAALTLENPYTDKPEQ